VKKQSQTKKLGDVCAFDKVQGIHRGLPYVGLEHIESHTARFIGAMEAQPVKSSTFRFSEEHVLYGRLRPYLNKALAPDFEGHCSTEIFPLRPSRELSRSYLLFWLLAEETCDRINSTCTGARMPRAQMDDVLEFEIPVPPLAEQQRIVGVLDEAFEGLATAEANAEKNLQNARALFESHLQSVFTQRGSGWVEKTLGDVFTTATGTTPPKNNAHFYGDFIPLVKPPELCDEAFDSASDGLSEAGAAVARTLPAKSILVSCIGNLGKIGLNTVPVAFNQQINAILPNESQAIPEFMFFQSLAPVFKSQLESLASGTTVPIVNKSKFNSVSVVLPPLSIQKAVAAQLSSLREETQHLARIYEQKLTALEALKKSLLHQAFSGEL
jgi:type I restriction enzyme S subunit